MVYGAVTWIFACATVVAVFVAYGIGANDVANAFGSSVGAKALTMKQALVVAAICEFGGSVLMGAGVVGTVRKGIARLSAFQSNPDIFAYGMLCAMMATGIWLLVATVWELPVSTTHSIVGAIIGMTMVSAGPDAVIWSESKDTFPYIGGVASLCLSWVFSPVLGGLLAAFLFFWLRLLVLRHENAYKRAFYVLPLFVFLTFFMISIFVIKEGGSRFNWENTPYSKACWIAAIVGAGTALISIGWQIWVVKRKVQHDLEVKDMTEAASQAGTMEAAPGSADGKPEEGSDKEATPAPSDIATPNRLRDFRKSRVWSAVTHSANVNIHETIDTDAKVHAIHENAEVFDAKAEGMFKYLQVFTACANSFAHGSNDVANSIGPYAAIYAVWQTSSVASEAEVPTWILIVGGAGLVVGLATYGYKIMRVLGVKMVKLTNSRGFIVEMSSAAIVIIGSRYGLPLSTTHTLVGAVTGVGLLEGKRGFNGTLLLRFFAGWVATLVVAAITAAAFTAQGIYAPNRGMDSQRYDTATYLTGTAWNVAYNTNNTAVLDMLKTLPNYNTSSENWKPMLYLSQGVQAQLEALLGTQVGACGNGTANPFGYTCPSP